MNALPTSLKEFEDGVIASACTFSVCRYHGWPKQTETTEFPSLKAALWFFAELRAAEPDRSKMRLLLYAVTAEGRSVCIAEGDFARCLKIRAECTAG